ncbi:hypothetical protein HUT18_15935 [Streptomyces sp. NA04227]|uniref:Rv1733c family protein n=1 Tax=Streptomyces sp. NA04227 TaxID=2742136 RepID=UPI001590ED18|nr:hypothetical protein [Streptomyces sp. NA04227]QKW07647.1 hypothetical protein HUT18_15935 [Streptomyces sp. NA04227]
MAVTGPTRQRFWHWRHNDLRRASDRFEAWMLLSAWTLAVVGGSAAGATAAGMVVAAAEQQQADRQEITATVADTAPAQTPSEAGIGDGRVSAPVRWTDDLGRVHHTHAKVPPQTHEGAKIAIWVGPDGLPISQPPSTGEQLGGAVATGSLTALGVGGTVLLTERGCRYVLDRRRLRQWEREWEVVGPTWRRKAM